MRPTYVFSSTYGRVLTVVTAGAAVVAVLAVAGDLPLRDVLTTALVGAVVTLLVWATLGRPQVQVSDGEVVLVNVTRTVRIPWPLVDHAEARWSLEVRTTDGRRWTAWAAPRGSDAVGRRRPGWSAPRAGVAWEVLPAAWRGDRGMVRRRATAAAVADALVERQQALLRAGHLDDARRRAEAGGVVVRVTWHTGTIAGLAVLSAAALAALTS